MNWKRVAKWTLVGGAGGVIGNVVGGASAVAYELLKEDKEDKEDKIAITFNIFLVGESGVGKDFILNILKGEHNENIAPTKELYKETLYTSITPPIRAVGIFGKPLLPPTIQLDIINTAGSLENDEENIQARKDLPKGKNTKYVYVFRVDKFFSDENYQKRVQWDIENAKEQCDRDEKGWDLVIIGTHKDKCNANDEQIQTLITELGEKDKFRCAIFDLTEAKGKDIAILHTIINYSLFNTYGV